MPSLPTNPERVGLILSSGQIVELANTSKTPDQSFSVAPEDMIKYEDEAVATWHTHPFGSAALSGEDLIGFRSWPDFLHLIFGVDNEVRGYIVQKGVVLKDANKNHSAWTFAESVAEWLRV